jgi:ribonuclease P protein component
MPPRNARLRREDRVRSSRDYRRVGRSGGRLVSRHFVVLVAPRFQGRPGDPARLGITASRRVGPAVERNRVKRRIRECFRRNRAAFPAESDVVVIAREESPRLSGSEVQREILELFR